MGEQWARPVLMDDKPALVSHITRNTSIEGVATKRTKILNPYGTFTMPRSLDGFARTSSEFVPAALICHRGPNHETRPHVVGGKPPIHLAHLTQIWSVHKDTFRTTQQVIQSLPPAEEPDYDPPLHPSPEKRPRLEQTHNQLHYICQCHHTGQAGHRLFLDPGERSFHSC